ncbi:hypothetical protein GCK72_025899 [Caenorhabditis remanei]|uniref:RING-type domain-containing protein n=1 Tax=Caenorhabditis remanei TaxID=31234 RepID=A0A6A5G3Z0_CAERE|nr:hypothetical protein GCK72_025899 [Caenorhabditis remanei]KAF1749431.1 hypothetical protein GCK72_025899 [Caenorhabditis remanei]
MVRNNGRVKTKRALTENKNSQKEKTTSQPVPKKRKTEQPQELNKQDEIRILREELEKAEKESREAVQFIAEETRRLKRENVQLEDEIRDYGVELRFIKIKTDRELVWKTQEKEVLVKSLEKGDEADRADNDVFAREENISQTYIEAINNLKEQIKNSNMTAARAMASRKACEMCQIEFNENFNESVPKILPCGHTSCLGCIKKLLTDGHVRCPSDRWFTKLNGSPESLPTNFAAL